MVLLPEMLRKDLETCVQFERGILFLLEIIKSWCLFFFFKSSTKKCYKHYRGIFLRDGFLEVELLDQWHTPLNVNSCCQVVSLYLLPCHTLRVHLSACSLTTLAIPKTTALSNIFLFSRLKGIFLSSENCLLISSRHFLLGSFSYWFLWNPYIFWTRIFCLFYILTIVLNCVVCP